MVIGWTLPSGVRHLAPWLYAFYIVGMAVHKADYFDRTLRQTCTAAAYEQHIGQVKYTLVPWVY